jgi:predicted phosphate transport protein (TIGR00153 family)
MVFPAETERRVKRRALNVLQDHLRKVVDISRKTSQLVDSFVKDDEPSARQLYTEILGLGDEIDSAKRVVAQELAEIGAILISRDDFLHFTDLTSEVADMCKGITFRLTEMMRRNWMVPPDINKGLVDLSSAVFDAVSKLRESLFTLKYGARKVLEKARDVEIAEKVVDDLYRELEIKILNSKMEIPTLLLLRDIIQLFEDIADKVEDASDASRILAFAM